MPATNNLINAPLASSVMEFYIKLYFSIIWIHETKNTEEIYQYLWYLAQLIYCFLENFLSQVKCYTNSRIKGSVEVFPYHSFHHFRDTSPFSD